jgi:hypothetical protein
MRYLAAALIVLASALWLGGLCSLYLFAPAIFKAFGPLFVAFARYQLVLAGLALIGAFLAYLKSEPERRKLPIVLFILFAMGAVGAVVNNMLFVPRLEELRINGQGQSSAFKSLHGQSMMLSLGITLAVFAAALVIPAACRALWALRPADSAD